MSEPVETLEDFAAGLLNGVMIFLLGAALPAMLLWGLASGWNARALDLEAASLADLTPLFVLTFLSFLCVRTGVRLIWRNAAALRRRRASPPPA